MSSLRLAYRLSRKIIGSAGDNLLWKYRHFFDPNWANSYLSEESLNHPHRNLILNSLRAFPQAATSLLEIGCASGPNLIRIAASFPNLKLNGLDVSAPAIEAGRKYIKDHNLQNIHLSVDDTRQIDTHQKYDIVLSDACLIYLNEIEAIQTLRKILSVARIGVLLVEHHTNTEKSFYDGNWVHNYRALLHGIDPSLSVETCSIPESIWSGNWIRYGSVITVLKK